MKTIASTFAVSLMLTALNHSPTQAQTVRIAEAAPPAATSEDAGSPGDAPATLQYGSEPASRDSGCGEGASPDASCDPRDPKEAPRRPLPPAAEYRKAEMELEEASVGPAAAGEEAVIETSHPYLLPRLFTLPTAYSLNSYELRFGGQGNIHNTLANLNTETLKASVALGLGGIMELGYQLDEYYTVQDISDKILMGYFKLSLLKESRFLPAAAISASKNLRSSFRTVDSYAYSMNEDMYELVFSKAFQAGANRFTIHPGVQVIRDEITGIQGLPALDESMRATKINPRLGLSWQSHPKTLFMYEFKMLHATDVSSLGSGGIATDDAFENNLGIRYYIRNWLCIDSGIRHYYDMTKGEDEMKLHANFVGVIPLGTVYERIQSHFRK